MSEPLDSHDDAPGRARFVQVFEAQGGRISLCDGWRTGVTRDKGAQWLPAEVGGAVDLLGRLLRAGGAWFVWMGIAGYQ